MSKAVKAVGLVSGGLDSALAAKLVADLGVEVHAVYCALPWGCGHIDLARQLAQDLGIPFEVIQFSEDYLRMLVNPRHGYGAAFNPCIDCHMYMINKAAEYLKEIGGDFVFTGEVIGQRPMSQRSECLRLVERGTSLQGRILRPLSAQLLPETIPEQQGLIDRGRLLGLSGRSRREQYRLAREWGVTTFAPPGGGCLLTEGPFGRRMKDFLQFGYRDFGETVILKWGRYFRLTQDFVALVGRDESENTQLAAHAYPGDVIMEPVALPAPTLVLKGADPRPEILSLCAGIIQFYSKYRAGPPIAIQAWPVGQQQQARPVTAQSLNEQQVEALRV